MYKWEMTWEEKRKIFDSPEVKDLLGEHIDEIEGAVELQFPLERDFDVESAAHRCPNCGRDGYFVSVHGKINNFCGYCGQRIDWEKEGVKL